MSDQISAFDTPMMDLVLTIETADALSPGKLAQERWTHLTAAAFLAPNHPAFTERVEDCFDTQTRLLQDPSPLRLGPYQRPWMPSSLWLLRYANLVAKEYSDKLLSVLLAREKSDLTPPVTTALILENTKCRKNMTPKDVGLDAIGFQARKLAGEDTSEFTTKYVDEEFTAIIRELGFSHPTEKAEITASGILLPSLAADVSSNRSKLDKFFTVAAQKAFLLEYALEASVALGEPARTERLAKSFKSARKSLQLEFAIATHDVDIVRQVNRSILRSLPQPSQDDILTSLSTPAFVLTGDNPLGLETIKHPRKL